MEGKFPEQMRKEEHPLLHFVLPPLILKHFEELSGMLKPREFLSSYFIYVVLVFLSYVHEIKAYNMPLGCNFNL